MKRRAIIGLSVTVLALSVIIGIASLPDEVLIDSSSIDNSPTLPEEILVPTKEEIQDSMPDIADKENTDVTKAELDVLKKEIIELKNELVQIKTNSGVPQDISTISEVGDAVSEENSHEEPQGRLITISIKDGVGAKMR